VSDIDMDVILRVSVLRYESNSGGSLLLGFGS
jgi:hypothetical protein